MPDSLGLRMQCQGSLLCSTWHILQAGSQEHFQGCFAHILHWSHCPAALQNFLEDMLDMLHNLGLKVPSQELPPIIWHDPATYFPGETLVNAMHAGASFFRAKPDIIFVCLPEKGRAAPQVSASKTPLVLSRLRWEQRSRTRSRCSIPSGGGSGQAAHNQQHAMLWQYPEIGRCGHVK